MLGEEAEDVQLAIEHLSKKQQIVRVRDDLYFAAERLLELQEQVLAFFADNEEMTPQDFKAITGASRKFSIPLAEYLDQKKITVRVGEVRKQLLRNG
jgi:selenocysteine-specific elongation factor